MTSPALARRPRPQGPGPHAVARRPGARPRARAAGGGHDARASTAAPGVGAGTELAQLREYQPGDDVRQLDAAASARTGDAARAPPGARAAHDDLDRARRLAVDGVRHRRAAEERRRRGRGDRARPARGPPRRPGGPDALRRRAPRSCCRRAAGRRASAGDRAAASARGGARTARATPRASGARSRGVGRLARCPGSSPWSPTSAGSAGWAGRCARSGPRHSLVAVEVRDPREETLPAVGTLRLVDPETGARGRGGHARPRASRGATPSASARRARPCARSCARPARTTSCSTEAP